MKLLQNYLDTLPNPITYKEKFLVFLSNVIDNFYIFIYYIKVKIFKKQ